MLAFYLCIMGDSSHMDSFCTVHLCIAYLNNAFSAQLAFFLILGNSPQVDSFCTLHMCGNYLDVAFYDGLL